MTKKKKATAAIAAVLAVALVTGAGTFAYVSATADNTYVNEFSGADSEDAITLEETTGGEYDIVPATWDRKDPTVSWEADLDSYVFIFVHESNPDVEGSDDKAIIYEIDPSWTELDLSGLDQATLQYIRELFGVDYDGDMTYGSNGNVKIYYKEAYGSGSSNILKNNQVAYNEAITEEMLEEWEANGTDIHLTFGAYIIQQAGFNDAYSALLQITTESLESLVSDVSEDGTATLTGSVTISSNDDWLALVNAINSCDEDEVTIDLNDYTLYINGVQNSFSDTENVTFKDGYIVEYHADNSSLDNTAWLNITDGTNVTFENVEIHESSAILILSDVSGATLTIENCAIYSTGYAGIATSHSGAGSENGSDTKIIVKDSLVEVIHSSDGDSYGIMVNGGETLEIEDSTIRANYQGVIVREGSADIKNSTIETLGAYVNGNEFFGKWSGGNAVAEAALVVGSNQNSTFAGYATATLDNVTLISPSSDIPHIDVANGSSTDATVVTGLQDSDTITCDYVSTVGPKVNGTQITATIETPVTVGDLAG